jgi:hypothetical protein
MPARALPTSEASPLTTIGERLLFLLLVDQFPNGIWGASLLPTSGFYGHEGDPGSISISTQSAFAISDATGLEDAPAVLAFRKYLLRRQSPDGAFGLLRERGTPKFPDSEIVKNARHTATALLFFLRYDGLNHRAVLAATRFLLDLANRTSSGLWVDKVPIVDQRVDPVTVAFVTGALEQVRACTKRNPDAQRDLPTNLEAAIETGLKNLFSSAGRTEDGFWVYRAGDAGEKDKVQQNIYQYTTDVLLFAAPAISNRSPYSEFALEVIARLDRIRSSYSGGLPTSFTTNVVSLDTTASLISARAALGANNSGGDDLRQLLKLCKKRVVLEQSSASGWAATLRLARQPEMASSLKCAPSRFRELAQMAHDVTSGSPEDVALPTGIGVGEEFIRTILRTRHSKMPT